MESVKPYHLFTGELAEGRGGLGRITVYLAAGFDRVTAAREALQLMLNDREEQLTSLEQRLYTGQQAREAAERRVVALCKFANEMVGEAFEGGSLDGGDIQDIAVKHGLLRIEKREAECGDRCSCREYGFPAECYRSTELMSLNPTAEAAVQNPHWPAETAEELAEYKAWKKGGRHE